jgi:hypothetical protein
MRRQSYGERCTSSQDVVAAVPGPQAAKLERVRSQWPRYTLRTCSFSRTAAAGPVATTSPAASRPVSGLTEALQHDDAFA